MASKSKARTRRLPLIYPDTVRPPPTLPGAESLLDLELDLTEEELKAIRVAMMIHTTSKQPKLTWIGWKHIAVALSIGSDKAQEESDGRMDTPDYRRVMGEFLRRTGFIFLNKDDRAAAVRILPRWGEIDAWRSSLPNSRQKALNNPRETYAAWLDHRRELGDPEAKKRPAGSERHKPPSWLEQMVALEEQVVMVTEQRDQAERARGEFAKMFYAIAEEHNVDDDKMAEIRARVRAERDAAPDVDAGLAVLRGPLAREVAPHHMPWYDRGYRGEPRGGNEAEQAAWDRGANDRMNADRRA
jgi:hypothetical protein